MMPGDGPPDPLFGKYAIAPRGRNFPDLLFGRDAWAAMLAGSDRSERSPALPVPAEGVTVGVDPYILPDAVVGCTELGRQLVEDMQKAVKAEANADD